MITTITPVYNKAEYLEPSINSLLSQHWGAFFGEIEHIFIDDWSTDNSLEILHKYKHDPRVRILENESNKGMAVSRTLGIYESKGDIIMLHDADEIIPPSYVYQMNLLMSQYHIVHPKTVYQYGYEHKIRNYSQDSENIKLPARMFYKKDFENKGGFEIGLGVFELGSFRHHFGKIGIADTHVIDLGMHTLRQVYNRSYHSYQYRQRLYRYYNKSMLNYHIQMLRLPLGLVTYSPKRFIQTLGAIKGYIKRV